MNDWIDVRNFDALMNDYQKSSMDNTTMPGLGTYLEKITEQNEKIITLLETIIREIK